MSASATKKNDNTEVTENNKVTEVTETETVETEVNRIPSLLVDNVILGGICKQYLDIFDEIAKYNKEVLQEKSSDWTQAKVLEKSRELGRPADPKAKPHADIRKALEAYENAVDALNFARKDLVAVTATELGITLSATAERNPEIEAPLKEKRKVAVEIGSQLTMISKLTNDEKASAAVNEFLENNPLPAIGRNQAHAFSDGGKTTPKYRVTVKIVKDGNVLLEESGFTKTALALTGPVFGYDRGKAPSAETLREAWEKAGNSAENPGAVSPVEFEDNNLHYTITKK